MTKSVRLWRLSVGWVAVTALTAPTLVGCGRQLGDLQPAAEITVGAASSLTEVMEPLVAAFNHDQPGVKVKVTLASSAVLARQLTEGAPIDLLATAGASVMNQAVSAGSVGQPLGFANNRLEIAVPVSNPAQVRQWRDLAGPRVDSARCVPAAPCGVTTDLWLSKANLKLHDVSQDPDVKAVLARVRTAQVDAGIVYVTDVRAAADQVRGIPIPDDLNVSTAYQSAVSSSSRNEIVAKAFRDFLASPTAQRILRSAGFGTL